MSGVRAAVADAAICYFKRTMHCYAAGDEDADRHTSGGSGESDSGAVLVMTLEPVMVQLRL